MSDINHVTELMCNIKDVLEKCTSYRLDWHVDDKTNYLNITCRRATRQRFISYACAVAIDLHLLRTSVAINTKVHIVMQELTRAIDAGVFLGEVDNGE